MTVADLNLINDTIIKHGDDWWNGEINDGEHNWTNREWIIVELLSLLAKEKLDLKVIRKNKFPPFSKSPSV